MDRAFRGGKRPPNRARNSRAAGAAAANDNQQDSPMPDAAGSLSNAVARPAAAAAAGAGAQNNNNDNNDLDDGFSPLLQSLLDHLVELAHQAGFAEELIEVSKARLLLEATAGQVALAAQLYWDDVLARTHQNQGAALSAPSRRFGVDRLQRFVRSSNTNDNINIDNPQPEAAGSSRSRGAALLDWGPYVRSRPARQAAVAAAAAMAHQQQRSEHRRAQQQGQPVGGSRRRQQGGAVTANINEPEKEDPGNNQGEQEQGEQHDEESIEEESVGEDEEQHDGPQPRLVQARGMEASVSVSDDEAAAVMLRTVKAVQKNIKHNRKAAVKRPSSEGLSLSSKQRRTNGKFEDHGDDDDKDEDYSDGYLSDNDWIWESLSTTTRESIPPVPPMDFLWGVPASPTIPFDENEDKDDPASAPSFGDNKEKTKKKPPPKMKNDDEDDEFMIADIDMDEDRLVLRAVSNKSASESPSNAEYSKPDMEESSGGGGGDFPDGGEDEDDDDEKVTTIPVTWLRAGFGFVDAKRGLSCKEPNEDDIGYLSWKQQIPAAILSASAANKNLPDPPYHCRSITILPAIVTALMHAGVTVVQEYNVSTPHVTCQTTQVPYFQLDEKNRALEWEPRFVDALTALLVIAARASKQRKAKALERAQWLEQEQLQQKHKKQQQEAEQLDAEASNEPSASSTSAGNPKKRGPPVAAAGTVSTKGTADPSISGAASASSAKWQKLTQKLQLCPTCWWEKTTDNANGQQGPSHVLPDPDEAFTIPLSYTHVCDLRAYVKSNLDSFLSTGGCALFLETILRIHGRGAVQRMATLARIHQPHETCGASASRVKNGKLPPLVLCKCQERFQKELHRQRMAAWPGAKAAEKNNNPAESGPLNDCASVELISLLLAGRVYSTWQGWSTSMSAMTNLGIGVLTDKPGEVGRGLTRPQKPVWIVKGPSQYSVLYLNERNSANVLECKGFVANMSHWSCWYGENHNYLTNFRFVEGRDGAQDRIGMGIDGHRAANHSNKENLSITVQLLDDRHKKQTQAEVDRKSVENIDDDHIFTQSDLDRVRVHPDDVRYYDNFWLWRYDIAPPDNKNNNSDEEEDGKPRGEYWTPFHRLDNTSKLLVETKLGPRLAVILRTRWPYAKIDLLDPPKPLPLI